MSLPAAFLQFQYFTSATVMHLNRVTMLLSLCYFLLSLPVYTAYARASEHEFIYLKVTSLHRVSGTIYIHTYKELHVSADQIATIGL
jgi:hypothetical protein